MIKKKTMMKRIWFPSEVYYAKGAISALKSIDEKKILVLLPPPVKNSENFEKIEKALTDKEVYYEVFESIRLSAILELKQKYLSKNIEVIVAIGGGSVMDPAKILRVFLNFPEMTAEDIAKNQFLSADKVKLVAVPTTPGTGSESNSVAVIFDDQGNKNPYINSIFVPDLVILDHNFLMSMSDQMVMEFCADIFAHAWEGSVSSASSSLIQGFAKSAIDLLKNAVNNLTGDKRVNALADILYAGHIAGIVQGNAFVGVCHALAHSFEVLNGVPHRKGILFFMRPVLTFYLSKKNTPEFNQFLADYEQMKFNNVRDNSIAELFNSVDKEKLIDLSLKDPAITTSAIRFNKESLMELINWIQLNK